MLSQTHRTGWLNDSNAFANGDSKLGFGDIFWMTNDDLLKSESSHSTETQPPIALLAGCVQTPTD